MNAIPGFLYPVYSGKKTKI